MGDIALIRSITVAALALPIPNFIMVISPEVAAGSEELSSAAVELSQRYITNRFLPDKAIDLMDEAASKLRMEINSKPEELDVLDRKIMQLEIEIDEAAVDFTIDLSVRYMPEQRLPDKAKKLLMDACIARTSSLTELSGPPESDEEGEEDGDDDDGFEDDFVDPELGEQYHLNHITSAADGTLYIGAEAGKFYRSGDGGES